MDSEDYFIVALIFAIAALLSSLMTFNTSPNSDSFILAWTSNVPQNNIHMYYTALSRLIFLPSAYFAIAFTAGGIVKTLATFVRKAAKKESK